MHVPFWYRGICKQPLELRNLFICSLSSIWRSLGMFSAQMETNWALEPGTWHRIRNALLCYCFKQHHVKIYLFVLHRNGEFYMEKSASIYVVLDDRRYFQKLKLTKTSKSFYITGGVNQHIWCFCLTSSFVNRPQGVNGVCAHRPAHPGIIPLPSLPSFWALAGLRSW